MWVSSGSNSDGLRVLAGWNDSDKAGLFFFMMFLTLFIFPHFVRFIFFFYFRTATQYSCIFILVF